MNVTAHFHGILTDWVGTPSASFDLSPKALLADLMVEIRRRFKDNMPEQLWDHEKNSFQKQILAVGIEGTPKSLENPLTDGEEIRFFIMMAGG